MTLDSKLMIVVWSWADRNVIDKTKLPQGSDRDFLKVVKDDKCVLFRYDPGAGNPKTALDDIEKVVKKFKDTHEILIFFHINHGFSTGNVNDMIIRCKAFDFTPKSFLFGHKVDQIYIGTTSMNGLLGIDGNLFLTFSGKKIEAYEIDVATNSILIKKDHFQSVWNYYFFKTKQNIFELKEGFIRAVLGKDGPDGPTIDPKSFERYKVVLQSFANKIETTDEGIEVYEDESKTYDKSSRMLLAENEIVDAFKAFLDQSKQLLSSPDLPTKQAIAGMNDAFCRLLNTLPEKTYAS